MDETEATSRIERILRAKMSGTAYTDPPLSRIEKLLLNMDFSDVSPDAVATSVSNTVVSMTSEEHDFQEADVDDIMSVLSSEND